ncbi:inositol monophosphatase family protein [Aerococcus sp. JJEM-2022b]|uniref:inositol monophosphatase family protein n=1 Tax=Aerococcus mictus TaxID=2976810 RepID=UPI00227C6EB7|nr:inositol monophosphatase family protein [Aerococcus mictus]MCY3077621.1 inositol monophosphatase family protein [Aerococcus mictus]
MKKTKLANDYQNEGVITMNIDQLDQEVKSWFPEIKALIQENTSYKTKEKRDFRDLATEIDIAAQELIENHIKQLPGHQTIIGEETYGQTEVDPEASHLWIIDPIDGTANFVKQKDNYATMITYFSHGQAKLAYVYDVFGDELYSASLGDGVYCNGKRLEPVADLSLRDSLIGISPQHNIKRDYFYYIADNAFDIRNYGCSSLDGISVIKGQYGAFVNPGGGPWDYAPFILMAQEMGLHFSNFSNQMPDYTKPSNFIIASPACFSELEPLIQSYTDTGNYNI